MKNLIAHRGLKINNSKENTIPAFLNALNDDNYVGLECDIWTTKDGHFVIHHSPIYKLKLIRNSTLKELKDIPTLNDLLKIKSNKIFLIEIKDLKINYEKLHNILSKEKTKKIYVMSFHNQVIKNLTIKERNYKLGYLNYVLNSENNYQEYDFICLLESVYSDKLHEYFKKQGLEIFLYAIHKDSSYNLNDLYFITDKIIA